MEFDLHSKVKAVTSIDPAVNAGTTLTGDTIDTAGFESLEHIVVVGVAFAGGGYDFVCQQAPDNAGSPGTWAAVPAADVIGGVSDSVAISVAIADANQVYRVGSVGKERFQRILGTESGTITAGIIGAVGVLSNPVTKPVADLNT